MALRRDAGVRMVLCAVVLICLCTDLCTADRQAQITKLATGIGAVGAGYGAHVIPAVLLRNLWVRPNYERVPRLYLITH